MWLWWHLKHPLQDVISGNDGGFRFMASHEFVAYIDESGDDGLKKYRAIGNSGGASRWLVLGCCLVRTSNDMGLIQHRDRIAALINQTQQRDIHFRMLKHPQKRIVSHELGKLPVRLLHVLSCKQHIPDPSIYCRKGQLYWYLCRLLIERISWCCWVNHRTRSPLVKLVFSTRGGMKYQEFRDYVTRLRTADTHIDWRTVDSSEEYIRSEQHARLAGLQFADITAASFAEAIEPNIYGTFESSYALALKPRVYQRNGNFRSYGVKILANEGALEQAQAEFLAGFPKSERPPGPRIPRLQETLPPGG